MNIVFVMNTMAMGGAERVATLLANHWTAQGHSVTIITTYCEIIKPAFSIDHRVEIIHIATYLSGISKPLHPIIRLPALRRNIVNAGADVVVSFLTNVNISTILATFGLNIPTVVSERSYPPSLPQGGAIEILRALLYPFATRVVMQTAAGEAWLKEKIPKAHGHVLPNPIAFPVADAAPEVDPETHLAKDAKLLLAVGRCSSEKRFDLLIQAFAASQLPPAWKLAILGDGPEHDRLSALALSLGLEGRVVMAGRVGTLDRWYRRADAFALTSHFEGFPNALAEAMRYGLPCIATDCLTGPAELMMHGYGLLVPSVITATELALKLNQLISRPALSEKDRTAQQDQMKAFYGEAVISNAWISLFNELRHASG